MPNTANVNFSVTNVAQNVSTPAKGITYMMGPTLLGRPAFPDQVISSWAAFKKAYGGLEDGNDFPLLCKRALDNGANLRINRVVHYTDPGDNTSNDGNPAELGEFLELVFDAPIITGNTINIAIDGTTTISVPFNTDNNTTLQDLADALETHPSIITALVEDITGDHDRIIATVISQTVTPPSTLPVITISTVTGGVSQAGITDFYSNAGFKSVDGSPLFTFNAKYQGEGYNKLRIVLSPASNGQLTNFNLTVYHIGDPSVLEEYTNLVIPPGGQTVLLSNFFDVITNNSNYIVPEYFDTTAILGSLTPGLQDQWLGYGDNGTAAVITDYIGDQAGETGLYSFDAYEDGMQLMVPNINTWDFHNSASAYVANRKDLQYDAWAAADDTAANVVSDRQGANIDTKFVNLYYGLIEVIHPVTGNKVEISPMGDLAGVIAKSDLNFGEWWSYAGSTRGVMNGILKVVNNFGTVGKKDDLQLLSQNQINTIINRDKKVYLSGNFTSQILDNTEKFTNVERLVLYLQKALRPTLESFLEDPNDPITWKRMYYTVKPFLDDLLTARAYFTYEWQGDQNISNINDAVINNPGDVANGKYKVNLIIAPIASLQEISIAIIITNSSVSFETGPNV